MTPRHRTSQEGHLEIAAVPLLSHGASIHHPIAADGETELRLAAYYKRPQVTELLLKHSTNIYDRNEESETLIDVALEEGPCEVV